MSALADAEALLQRANVKVVENNPSDAFPLYVQAAQAFLHLSRILPESSPDKVKCRTNATKALEYAEKIKQTTRTNAPRTTTLTSSDTSQSLKPINRNRFSKEDQFAIIDISSTINGHKFPPLLPHLQDETGTPAAGSLFTDPDGEPCLAPSQLSVFSSWSRPNNINQELVIICQDHKPEAISQEIVTDCSVVAGLIVCWEHHLRFNSKLLLSSIFPQDANGYPVMSVNGRYSVHLLFNGAVRKVTIDDRLPVDKENRLICVSTGEKAALWPSLVEKAYMKLMGGYDFPGSNTSLDLHTLTGWIPEHICLQSGGFQREKTWGRLSKGFTQGHCVITLGTGREAPRDLLHFELVPEHCYAVTDLAEAGSNRTLKVCNPWHRGGSYWIDWDDACVAFESIYLNWSPNVFEHISSFHGVWGSGSLERTGILQTLDHNVQIEFDNQNVKIKSKAESSYEVWVLLTRHITSTARDVVPEYIALKACRSLGIRDFNRRDLGGALVYTDSPQTLLRVSIDDHEPTLSLFPLRDVDSEDSRPASTLRTGYTISVFSPVKFRLVDSFEGLTYSKTIESSFTPRTSGGNSEFRTFMNNPQYSLVVKTPSPQKGRVISDKTSIRATLVGHKNIPVNIKILWGGGNRVTDLMQGDIAVDSGAYTYALASVLAYIQPGIYTLVCSTFEPGQTGPFSLSLECSTAFDLLALPQEGAGAFLKSVRGTWSKAVASSTFTKDEGSLGPRYKVEIKSATKLLFRLQQVSQKSEGRVPINLAIYQSAPNGALGDLVVSTGPFNEKLSGVSTALSVFEGPSTYIAVPSAYTKDATADFELMMYSTVNTASIVLMP